jgi:hypothetical protein
MCKCITGRYWTKYCWKLNEEQIFSKIYEISNNLLLEYNNEFLKEDFCNKIAIIYEKKLSNFNVKILKNLYNNINSENIDNQMMMTLQYIPKPDDEFLTDVFKDNLTENILCLKLLRYLITQPLK